MRGRVALILLLLTPLQAPAATLLDLGDLLSVPRSAPTAVVGFDGRVTVLGGNGVSASIDVVDAAYGTAETRPGVTPVPLAGHAAATLDDGRILLTGGSFTGDSSIMTATWGNNRLDVYDPIHGTVTPAGKMTEPRMDHQATTLRDGRVLITGGCVVRKTSAIVQTIVTDGAEIYDPVTGSVRNVGPMRSTRFLHTATLLEDGRVLIAGGANNQPYPVWPVPLPSTEIFDPASETFAPGPDMATARIEHTATLLANGRVLLAGGRSQIEGPAASPALEIFDPATAQLRAGAHIGGRWGHTATRMLDGNVLFFGGAMDAVVYDPASDRIIGRTALPAVRSHHAATLLRAGSVLVTGGVQPRADGALIGVRNVSLYTTRIPRRRAAGLR